MSLSSARRRSECGFTLTEMLVSLALLGLAAALLVAGTGQLGQAVARMRGERDRQEDVIQAQRLLRARLERLSSVVRSDSIDPVVDAEGRETEFSFVAPAMERDQPAGLMRYRLVLTSSRDLVLFSAHPLSTRADSDGGLSGWRALRLLSGAKRLSITYLGPDKLNGGRRWQAFWHDQPEPPELVRVNVGFSRDDRRRWPELVVRPRANSNTACQIDAITGRCGSGK